MSEWQPIATAPKGRPLILANYSAMCLLTGMPHIWSARWEDWHGEHGGWVEASIAAEIDNGEPTHWCEQPTFPKGYVDPDWAHLVPSSPDQGGAGHE